MSQQCEWFRNPHSVTGAAHVFDSGDRNARHSRNRNTRHLTNYSLNKYSDQYSHHDDPADATKGTKRTLSSLMKHLGEQGTQLWADISDVVARTTEAMGLACTDSLAGEMDFAQLWQQAVPKGADPSSWNPQQIGPAEWRDCFHVLGFDILIEDRGVHHSSREGNCRLQVVPPPMRPYAASHSVFSVFCLFSDRAAAFVHSLTFSK